MSSYHFPILLGQNKSERIVIVHLVNDRDREDYTEKRVVITTPGSPSTALFKIPKQVKIVGRQGVAKDPTSDVFIDDGKERMNNKNKQLLKVSNDGDILLPVEKFGFYEFHVDDEKFDGIVEFSLSSYDNMGNIEINKGSLHIVRPHWNDTMVRLTADLGSDATQVSYVKHELGQYEERPLSIKLIDRLKEAYSVRAYPPRPSTINEPLFIQEEKNNSYYYKTGNITFRDEGYIDKGIDQDDCFINYLTVSAAGKNNKYADKAIWQKEGEFNRKLINIKMLYSDIGDPQSPAVGAVDFSFKENGKDKLNRITEDPNNLLKVLQAIYQQIIKISTKQFEKECEYFSIMLLVPNIYSQINIDRLLYELNSLMNPEYNEESSKEPAKKKKRKLFDFRIISESDSAFIGLNEVGAGNMGKSLIDRYLDRQNITENEKKDTFLIIDAGKGTTDYSIVRYTRGMGGAANNQVTSLDRNGIVGAGGAIDYVFARILARQIYRHRAELDSKVDETDLVTETQFVKDFMTMIQYLYPVDQDRFMLIVETLKISYRTNDGGKKWEMAKMFKCFSDKESVKIIDLLLKKDLDKIENLKVVSTQYIDGLNGVAKCRLDEYLDETEVVSDNDRDEVEKICSVIAETIINEQVYGEGHTSLTNSIDYVIFTGRSFLFKPLKDAFVKAIIPQRGVFRENYKSDIRGKVLYWRDWLKVKYRSGLIELYGNLKIAEGVVEAKDMKPISVRYKSHNLGVNCNSNLCCVKGLSFSGKDNEIIKKDRFWKGFSGKGDAAKNNYYYIGYFDSFGCSDDAKNAFDKVNGLTSYTHKEDLIKMTLFPVRYQPVDLFRK